MKKIIFCLFLLTSCSFNSDSVYWKDTLNSNYEKLKYDKDYTINEYGKILDQYSDRNEMPNLN